MENEINLFEVLLAGKLLGGGGGGKGEKYLPLSTVKAGAFTYSDLEITTTITAKEKEE